MKKALFGLVALSMWVGAVFGSIVVHEVSFTGRDEWIYLQNTGFSGDLQLVGAKSTVIQITTQAGEDIVIGDNDSNISGWSGTYLSNQGLSLSDSSAWELSLVASGVSIDIFFPTSQEILTAKAQGNTLQRETLGVTIEEEGEDIPLYTGTATILTPGGLLIDKIHASDTEQGGEYIDIIAHQDYSGQVEISGLGQSNSSKHIEVSLLSGEIVRISDTPESYPESYEIASMSLTDSGEVIKILGQDGQVIDSVVYTKHTKGAVLKFISKQGEHRFFGDENSGEGDGGGESFQNSLAVGCSILVQQKNIIYDGDGLNLQASNKGKPLRNGAASYYCEWEGIPIGEATKCNPTSYPITAGLHTLSVTVYYEGEQCRSSTMLQIPKKPYLDIPQNPHQRNPLVDEVSAPEVHLENQSRYSPNTYEIIGLLPNPAGNDSDMEGIQLLNKGGVDLDTSGLTVKSEKRSRDLGEYTLAPGEALKLIGDFGLYNSANCVTLENTTGTIYSKVCYPDAKDDIWYTKDSGGNNEIKITTLTGTGTITDTQEVDSYTGEQGSGSLIASERYIVLPGLLDITSILPNPSGKDSVGESLRISMSGNGDGDIDMSSLVVNAGKRSTPLGNAYIQKNTEYIRTGNLGLYNSPSCIRLESINGTIYDEFCYPKAKEGVWYSHSNDFVALSKTDWMKDLSLTYNEDQVCIQHNEDQLLCKDNVLYTYKKKFEKEQIKRKSDAVDFLEKIENYKLTISNIKEELSIHKTFIYDSMQLLQQDRYAVFTASGIQEKYTSRKGVTNKEFEHTISLDISTEDIYHISHGILPLVSDTLEIDTLMRQTTKQTKQAMASIQDNLRTK